MNTFKQCDYYNVIRTAEEEAREKGLAEGRAEGLSQGLAEGRAEGRAEGMAEGLSQGLAEGRAEATRAIALKLISTGMPIEQIAEIIGVPIAELQGIQ